MKFNRWPRVLGKIVLFYLFFNILLLVLVVASDAPVNLSYSSKVESVSVDWWTMHRRDPAHTSFSSSKAPETNETLWTKYFTSWVRSSISVHENVVFVGTDEDLAGGFGAMRAFNAFTGESLWNYSTGADVVSTPAVSYGHVYFGCDDWKLYCLDESTGNYSWHFLTGGKISSSPCVVQDKVLFGSEDGKLYCLNAHTGGVLWSFQTGDKIISSPAVSDGKVFFGSFDRTIYALNLADGSSAWSYTISSSILTAPSVSSGLVYVTAGIRIYCLNAATGSLVWSYTTGSSILSSPAVAYGNVYFGSNDDKIYCLRASDGMFRWSFLTGDDIYSSPAVAERKVFFGSFDNIVYCLNAYVGTEVWRYQVHPTNCRIYSSPAIANLTLYVACCYDVFDGKIVAIQRVNHPPAAENLDLTPAQPYTTDDLTGSYDYNDQDGDPEVGTEIRWYMNMTLQPLFNDTLVIPNAQTSRGESWYFTVKPGDGVVYGATQTSPVVTVQNSLPQIGGVNVSPDPAYTDSTLTASPYGWTDADGDPESHVYQWQRWDGAAWQNITGETSPTLAPANFVKHDQIKVVCTPFDGLDYGTSKTYTLTILNTAPSILTYFPLDDPVIIEYQIQVFNITKHDQDNDPLTVTWLLNQTDTGVSTDTYTFTADSGSGTFNVTVVLDDGEEQDFHTWTLTVLPVMTHDVAVINASSTKSLVCQGYNARINVTVANEGEAAETFNVTLKANMTAVDTLTAMLQPGENQTLTFTWNTTTFSLGNYNITAHAETVPGEVETWDNTHISNPILLTIPGDVNGDHKCNLQDIYLITLSFGSEEGQPRYEPNYDINDDGKIDMQDTFIAILHYGEEW